VASVFSHAALALSIASCFYEPATPKRLWATGAVCSVLPDLDVIGFRYGVPYGDFWGHRGFTHSLIFAALLAGAVVGIGFRKAPPGLTTFSTWLYLFFSTATHGVLDAMTDGGPGGAFFSPFDNSRYFLPWTPIRVSPIGFGRFFTFRGLVIIRSELLWIWLPAGLFAASVWILRRTRRAADA